MQPCVNEWDGVMVCLTITRLTGADFRCPGVATTTMVGLSDDRARNRCAPMSHILSILLRELKGSKEASRANTSDPSGCCGVIGLLGRVLVILVGHARDGCGGLSEHP